MMRLARVSSLLATIAVCTEAMSPTALSEHIADYPCNETVLNVWPFIGPDSTNCSVNPWYCARTGLAYDAQASGLISAQNNLDCSGLCLAEPACTAVLLDASGSTCYLHSDLSMWTLEYNLYNGWQRYSVERVCRPTSAPATSAPPTPSPPTPAPQTPAPDLMCSAFSCPANWSPKAGNVACSTTHQLQADVCGGTSIQDGSTGSARCCSHNGANCVTTDVGGSCYGATLTYSQAMDVCALDGRRLCTLAELTQCCGTGCNYDYTHVWVSDVVPVSYCDKETCCDLKPTPAPPTPAPTALSEHIADYPCNETVLNVWPFIGPDSTNCSVNPWYCARTGLAYDAQASGLISAQNSWDCSGLCLAEPACTAVLLDASGTTCYLHSDLSMWTLEYNLYNGWQRYSVQRVCRPTSAPATSAPPTPSPPTPAPQTPAPDLMCSAFSCPANWSPKAGNVACSTTHQLQADVCGGTSIQDGSTGSARCCSHNGANCVTTDVGGSCYGDTLTYSQAMDVCALDGRRLCTLAELTQCCGTGCNYDYTHVWVSDVVPVSYCDKETCCDLKPTPAPPTPSPPTPAPQTPAPPTPAPTALSEHIADYPCNETVLNVWPFIGPDSTNCSVNPWPCARTGLAYDAQASGLISAHNSWDCSGLCLAEPACTAVLLDASGTTCYLHSDLSMWTLEYNLYNGWQRYSVQRVCRPTSAPPTPSPQTPAPDLMCSAFSCPANWSPKAGNVACSTTHQLQADVCGAGGTSIQDGTTGSARCCSHNGANCVTTDAGGSCYGDTLTYSQAMDVCALDGRRLCTVAELTMCCGTGCNYDYTRVWVSDVVPVSYCDKETCCDLA